VRVRQHQWHLTRLWKNRLCLWKKELKKREKKRRQVSWVGFGIGNNKSGCTNVDLKLGSNCRGQHYCLNYWSRKCSVVNNKNEFVSRYCFTAISGLKPISGMMVVVGWSQGSARDVVCNSCSDHHFADSESLTVQIQEQWLIVDIWIIVNVVWTKCIEHPVRKSIVKHDVRTDGRKTSIQEKLRH
jgi:hypothetical protein